MRVWLVTLTVVLAGCSANRMPDTPLEPYSLNEAQVESVKRAVSSQFKDPNSAQFEEFVSTRQGGTVHVCGRVNAKNSFGGYGGFRPFWADVTEQTAFATVMNSAVDGNEMSDAIVKNQCRTLGLSVR